MAAEGGRLRRQLTRSHLLATGVTLAGMMVAASVIVTVAVSVRQPSAAGPLADARSVAEAAGGLVPQSDPVAADNVLEALASGRLRLPVAGWAGRAPWSSDAT